MVHCKRPFIDETIYAEKLKSCRISEKLQEKIVLDNLLTSVRLDIEFPSGGYSTRHFACEIREESQQSNYINDSIVCFTMNDVIVMLIMLLDFHLMLYLFIQIQRKYRLQGVICILFSVVERIAELIFALKSSRL